MVSLAAIVVVGGVAPFVLHAAVGPRQVWRVCGVGLGLALACVAGYNAWIAHRAKGTVAAPRQPVDDPFLHHPTVRWPASHRAAPSTQGVAAPPAVAPHARID